MDNFRETEAYGIKGFSKLKTSQNKGHLEQFKWFMDSVKNNYTISFDEIYNVTKASFCAVESLKTNG